ncbi:MAG: hypothetical protein DLM67_08185 [Candidatus Nephthysia bennettiae]|uniref:Uncharacterized protein n=1 Tax=Candidatus Nephthysia bennettiae TaxID=3127016 RepID=A0A934N8X9_9BACT|nr:hypothetical protein [Candidatus Dormibacteraeota bacterium]MBJ7614775.1 hypothetical protein [Candidatus Dormibacteraeota bacterium]PZR97329.1 MAG: hypothetical protein DLM67_08185 [Candidatus Dormibacteraeota bacterium]
MPPEAEEFARLPGEEHGTAPDAEHCVLVCQELIGFSELMLTGPELHLEAGQIHRRLAHYRCRLSYWQGEEDPAG